MNREGGIGGGLGRLTTPLSVLLYGVLANVSDSDSVIHANKVIRVPRGPLSIQMSLKALPITEGLPAPLARSPSRGSTFNGSPEQGGFGVIGHESPPRAFPARAEPFGGSPLRVPRYELPAASPRRSLRRPRVQAHRADPLARRPSVRGRQEPDRQDRRSRFPHVAFANEIVKSSLDLPQSH